MLSCYNLSVGLLLALLLNSNLASCKKVFLHNADIFTNETLQRPEVRIPQGKIQGLNMMSRSKREFFGFQGIPYAQPPVGNLRFKAPLPADAWNGTRDGSIVSNICPQENNTTIDGSEDCLYINVFTPQLPAIENFKLLPVMVFVFGGGFLTGSNSPLRYGPQFILDKDVVLVTPNYRMGILGYLSTGDEISPGNYALKDLVLALKWIRDNIRYFGGDPDRVTLMGGSSGAMSIHLLTLSDSTKGLFQRYITDSGSALSFSAFHTREACVRHATRLGEYFGCPTKTSTVLVDCLRGLNASQIVNASSAFYKWYKFPRSTWGPGVEPEVKGALFTETPENLIAAGKSRDLPWMASITRDEGIYASALFYNNLDTFQEFLDNLDSLMPIVLQYGDLVDNVTMYTDTLKSYYLNDLTADIDLLLVNFTQLMGDGIFGYGLYRGIRQYLPDAKYPHYLASFEYRGTISYSYSFSGGSTTNWGVAHGDELIYLLLKPKSLFGPPGWEFNENDWKMVDTMVQLWTSFVINGAPIIPDSNVVWEPISSQDNYLRIGNGSDIALEVGYNFNAERMRIWDELYAATSWRST